MLDEMVQLVTKEKKEEAQRSEASGNLYNSLLAHIEHLRLTNSKERSLLQAEIMADMLDFNTLTGSNFSSKKDKLTKEQKP